MAHSSPLHSSRPLVTMPGIMTTGCLACRAAPSGLSRRSENPSGGQGFVARGSLPGAPCAARGCRHGRPGRPLLGESPRDPACAAAAHGQPPLRTPCCMCARFSVPPAAGGSARRAVRALSCCSRLGCSELPKPEGDSDARRLRVSASTSRVLDT